MEGRRSAVSSADDQPSTAAKDHPSVSAAAWSPASARSGEPGFAPVATAAAGVRPSVRTAPPELAAWPPEFDDGSTRAPRRRDVHVPISSSSGARAWPASRLGQRALVRHPARERPPAHRSAPAEARNASFRWRSAGAASLWSRMVLRAWDKATRRA